MRRTVRDRLTTATAAFVAALAALAPLEAASGEYRTQIPDTDGKPLELYAEEQGTGPPLLLLHGLGESTFTWRKVVGPLAARHRVIALDLKGFGRSAKPRGEAYTADHQARHVAAFIAARGLTGLTLVGHSFGGTVALRAALLPSMQGRIARIVAVSAPALPGALAPRAAAVEIPLIPDALAAALPPPLIARTLLSAARDGGSVPEADIEGYAAPYYDLDAKRAFLATARHIVGETNARAIARRYRTLDLPVLIVWCRKDPIVPLSSARRLQRILKGSELKVLEGCHHLPQDERPAALLAALEPFLSE